MGKLTKPRYAAYLSGKEAEGVLSVQRSALWFRGVNSVTGEEVL